MQVLDWSQLNEISREIMFVEGFLDFMFKTVQSNNQRYQLTQVSHQHPSIIFTQYLTSHQLSFNLVWTLQRKENWNYQFEVRPQYLQKHGVTLKADNHSTVIEFLDLIANLNTQQKYWTAFISQSDELHLKYTLQPKPFILSSHKIWWQQLMSSALFFFQKIVIILQPYSLEPPQNNKQTQNIHVSTKIGKEEDLTSIYIDMIQGEIRSKAQYEMISDKKNYNSRVVNRIIQIAEKKIFNRQKERTEMVKLHQQSFRILGIEQPLNWKRKKVTSNLFKKKDSIIDQTTKDSMKFKNVQAIKHIKPLLKKKIIDPGDETHCTIRVGVFHVQLVDSISPQANQLLMAHKKLEERHHRQMELVVKTPDNKSALSILNSFKNELKFIKFIRNCSGCPKIANFYLEELQKQENNYFLMDYYPLTLEQFNRKRQGSVLNKLRILREIAQGLEWINQMYICHRDIKPMNIMIDFNNKVKIIDFGGCCPHISQSQIRGSFQAQTNRFLGTATYYSDYKQYSILPMAKKYSKDAYRQHPAFDVYSFGRVMQDTLSQDLDKLKDIGNFLKYVWRRCMSLIPQDRPQYWLLVNILDKIINHYNSRGNKLQQ